MRDKGAAEEEIKQVLELYHRLNHNLQEIVVLLMSGDEQSRDNVVKLTRNSKEMVDNFCLSKNFSNPL